MYVLGDGHYSSARQRTTASPPVPYLRTTSRGRGYWLQWPGVRAEVGGVIVDVPGGRLEDLVDLAQSLWVEDDGTRGRRLFELLLGPCPDDRRGDPGLRGDPGQAHGGQRHALLVRNPLEPEQPGAGDLLEPLRRIALNISSLLWLALQVLAAQHPSGQRRPWDDT